MVYQCFMSAFVVLWLRTLTFEINGYSVEKHRNNHYCIKKFSYIKCKKSQQNAYNITMSKVQHKSYIQNDSQLFPPYLGNFISDNDRVHVLNAIVDNLDINALEVTYKSGRCNSYHPHMLIKMVLYAYLQNVYSGRKMAH